MAAEQPKTSRILTALAGIAICCTVALALFYGPRLIVYYYLHRDEPVFTLTPQSLSDHATNAQEGRSFSQFGYEFEVPWKDVDRVDNLKSVARIYFKSGPVLIFFDPQKRIDRIKALDATTQNGNALRVLFGPRAPISNYELLKAILSTTPQDVSPLTGTNDLFRNSMLLTLKLSELPNGVSYLYSIETPSFRGFQKGDPLHDKKVIILDLFNRQDHELELWVGRQQETSATITQADINRIVQTLHPTSELR